MALVPLGLERQGRLAVLGAHDRPQLVRRHRDLAGLLIWLLAHARGGAADDWLRTTLLRRLDDLEGSLR